MSLTDNCQAHCADEYGINVRPCTVIYIGLFLLHLLRNNPLMQGKVSDFMAYLKTFL